jgi:hypothetical protein
VTIALALSLAAAAPASARDLPAVRVLLLPPQTTVRDLAEAGLAPGVMSPGLGTVRQEQTYLDIGQGNRVFDSLYDEPLEPLGGHCRDWQRAAERRAETAPADIVPFLLSREAWHHGIFVFSVGESGCQFGAPRVWEGRKAGNLTFAQLPVRGVTQEVRRLGRADLLIAIAEPMEGSDALVAIGIAGGGFDGDLTSDTTRTDGYVLSTDVAPTILDWFGLDVPSAMSGQPIRGEGTIDAAAIESLAERMAVIPARRGPVIGLNIALWLASLALVLLGSRGRWTRSAVRVVGLAVVYLPLVLLLGAALEPGETAERLLALLLPPLLGAGTVLAFRGYRALAVASAVTVLAYAVDMLAGSPLTSLSLLGPNPGLGVRFYGIGNELEAVLVVLAVGGTGAWLAGFGQSPGARHAALVFALVGLLCAFVFAAGRFGADVGAAIVFPVGAAVAAATALGGRRRWTAMAVLAAPFAVLALLALIDLVSGANAHLTRSVLDAGGLGDLADVAQRRLQLSAHSFGRPMLLAFLPVVAILAAIAYRRRERIAAWLEPVPAMRAGLLGALAATAVGTLANDSGALILEVGTAYLLVFLCFAWVESRQVPETQTKSYNLANHVNHTSHPHP